MRKRTMLIHIIGILIFGVIVCGCVEQKTGNNIQNNNSVKNTISEKTVQNFVTVVDATGKKVKIKEPVEKVITVYGLAPPFIYLLGEGDKYYAGWMWGTKFYKLIDDKVEEKASRGKTLNVEEIIKENPSFVIAAYWQANEKDVKQLESLGVPVVCIKVESVDDIYKTIEILGKIFQKENYANEIINYYKSNVENIEKRVSNIKEKPKVLVLYYSGKAKAYKTFGGDMFQSKLVEIAGGVSVSKDLSGKKTINVEQVAEWNPDVILIIQYGTSAEKIKENILNDPAWSKINAVKNKKVYIVPNDGENWIDPCPKWILGLYWIAKTLHPEEFKDINITEKADEFYKKFFGLSVDEVNIKVVIILNKSLILIYISIFVISLFVGRYLFYPWDINSLTYSILFDIRLPRIIAVSLAGAALALAGLAFQNLFRNYLAGPGVLGVTSGSAFGAVFTILAFSLNPYLIQGFSFIFGIVAVVLAYKLGKCLGESLLSLILAGMIVSAFFQRFSQHWLDWQSIWQTHTTNSQLLCFGS